MKRMTVSVLAIATCLSLGSAVAASAYEGPQERALDKSLQDYDSQGYTGDATSQLNSAPPVVRQQDRTASAATQLDEPLPARPIQHEPSTEGPQEKALDQSLMNYRIQQDSANGAPVRDVQ